MAVVHFCGRNDPTTSASSLPSSSRSNAAGATNHSGLPDAAKDVVPRHLLSSARSTTSCSPDAGTEGVNVSNSFHFIICTLHDLEERLRQLAREFERVWKRRKIRVSESMSKVMKHSFFRMVGDKRMDVVMLNGKMLEEMECFKGMSS